MSMTKRVVPVAVSLFFTLLGQESMADIRPPDFTPPNVIGGEDTPIGEGRRSTRVADLVVRRGDEALTRIVIPRHMVAEFQPRPERDDAVFVSPTRSVFAGLALSVAMVSGFFMVRRGGTGSKIAASLLVGAGLAAAASTTLADLPPPGFRPPEVGRPVGPRIVIEISDRNTEEVTLILEKNFLRQR